MTLYDHPEYYDIAFSFRDLAREARFLRTCIDEFSAIKVQRVLEIGCGNAPHAGELSELGYRYHGLDNNRNMIDFASTRWCHLKPSPVFILDDMASFTCPQKVDFAFVMLGSLYLDSLEAMMTHFDSMAGVLRLGGLYFLDYCIQFADPLKIGPDSDFTSERDGIKITSRIDVRLLDTDRKMYEEVWTVDVNDHGDRRRFRMVEQNHAILPQEFLLFIKARTDFEFVGWWADWDFSKPISESSTPDRPIALVRRK